MNKNCSILGIISILTIAIASVSINNVFAQSDSTDVNDANIRLIVHAAPEGGEGREEEEDESASPPHNVPDMDIPKEPKEAPREDIPPLQEE